jgi:hypothetical protein
LLLGNLNTQMGRPEKAREYFQAAVRIADQPAAADCCSPCPSCPSCSARTRVIAKAFLDSPRE